jgi:hypothetical protein
MRTMTRRGLSCAILSGLLATAVPARTQAQSRRATLYKNPQCDCCEGYAAYLRQNGIAVTVIPTHDLVLISRENGVPPSLEGCHVTLLDGYVVVGHVPFRPIYRLLTERPSIKGISLPGMPLGSPGMTGRKAEPFTVYEISDGAPRVYAVE